MQSMVNHSYELLWAKTNPYKSLVEHMIDSGYCAKAYIEASSSSSLLLFLTKQWDCTKEEASAFVSYLVAMHDIGKATPQFQMQNEEQMERLKATVIGDILPKIKPEPSRHEYLSRLIAKRLWREQGESNRIYDAYSYILSLHHQKTDYSDFKKQSIDESWKQIQAEIESVIRKTFGFSGKLPTPKEVDPVCILLTGILILCDWVASSDLFNDVGLYDHKTRSHSTAQKAVKLYGLVEKHEIKAINTFQDLWPFISSPRDIQNKCEELDPSALLTIIEAPMGEGKTEAALYQSVRAAQYMGKRGLYMALPTQATSNQMYGRFVNMMDEIGGGHTRLLHGTAFLMKDNPDSVQSEDANEAEKWLGTSRMGLLDENGVGTVDQAMGSVLLARFSVLRLLGLSNKVLIIDELHAYDAYMSKIIKSLLCWCRSLSVPVILLSATLQNSQRIKYLSCYMPSNMLPELSNNYPLITQVKGNMTVVQTIAAATMRTKYDFVTQKTGENCEDIVRFALEQVKNGGCYCILVNTVRRAQEVYRKLKEIRDPDTEILLFHARFTMGKREEREKECLRMFGKGPNSARPMKAILVATQVVEQSLDIDFDGMISEIAPIDLLLQRAGRVHRHRNLSRPEGLTKPVIYVVLPGTGASNELDKRYGASGYVYDPFLLYNTEKLLGNRKEINVPEDVRSVIAQAYENITEENMSAWLKRDFDQQLEEANADHKTFPVPATCYFFPAQSHPEFEDINIDDGFDPSARVATRLGEPTFRISFANKDLLKAAQEGRLTKKQQKEVLLASVSLRLTKDALDGLASSKVYQIEKGALYGCYITDADNMVYIGKKKLVNDLDLGVFWEGQ